MSLLQLGMMLAIVLVTLVAGIVLCFAVVVMPGIKSLNDHDFLHSFKAMDRVIQENHPVFMLVWLGSIMATAALAGLGLFQLDGLDRILLVATCAIYLLGAMLPTSKINVPLNNELQRQDLERMSDTEIKAFRHIFESTWNRWNMVRTMVATTTGVILVILLIRI